LITRFPFGLIEKQWGVRHANKLLVYPAVEPVRVDELDHLLNFGDRDSPLSGSGATSSELREYRAGDEARFIHWRRSAALAKTVVRERKRETGPRLLLRLDNRRPSDAGAGWDDAFEAAVSRVASLAAAGLARGAGVQVQTWSGASPNCAPHQSPDPIWGYLALVTDVPFEVEEVPAETRSGQTVITLTVTPGEKPGEEEAVA
jgi:uncharacterized protein (DUF58 family)